MRIKLLALLALTFAVGCRGGGGGDDGGGDDDGMTVDAPPSGLVKIQDIQNDAMAKGTAVELKGVVVTALDVYGDSTGGLFVEEPGGGPYSGIKVFGASVADIATLAIGDIVSITNAEKDEFKFGSDTGSVTEIKGRAGGKMVITKTGTGTVPTPGMVDAVELSKMGATAAAAEWEKWEGVLITVTHARQITSTAPFGSTPHPDATEFRISGIARVQSALMKLPDTSVFGLCYDKITGLGDHFFNDLIMPRSPDDLVGGGTGCRGVASNIVELQTGTDVEAVGVTNGFVTARGPKGFWVADSLTGAANNGVFVFTGSAPDAKVVLGVKVSVQGGAQEFDVGNPAAGDKLTEISGIGPVTVSTDPVGTLVPLAGDPVLLGDIGAPGEPFEGVFVSVEKMKVNSKDVTNKRYELKSTGGAILWLDDESFEVAGVDVGNCIDVIGVMSVDLTANLRTINPRRQVDIATATGCAN